MFFCYTKPNEQFFFFAAGLRAPVPKPLAQAQQIHGSENPCRTKRPAEPRSKRAVKPKSGMNVYLHSFPSWTYSEGLEFRMTGAASYCFFGIRVVAWGAGMGMSRISDAQTLKTLWIRWLGAG